MSSLLTPKTAPLPRNIPADITAQELQHWLAKGRRLQLIDVREPQEFAAGHLPRAVSIPLGQIAARAAELDRRSPAVIYCKAGVRSAKAILALREAGYSGPLINLKDGITGWANDVRVNAA